jgi:hypothetical protein
VKKSIYINLYFHFYIKNFNLISKENIEARQSLFPHYNAMVIKYSSAVVNLIKDDKQGVGIKQKFYLIKIKLKNSYLDL